ncbi:MAG: aldehyde dehydrogenase family protein, partial [Oscillibacter sp.]|nr:aldehyde dehydrogenase family protein [Oscillibacter sp.]
MEMIINGKRLQASDGKTQDVFNPATGELVDTVPAATSEDAQACLQAAYVGKTEWAATPLYKRVAISQNFARLLHEKADELGHLLCREMGKPIGAAVGEVHLMAGIAQAYSEHANHLYDMGIPDNCAGFSKDHIFTRREPLGV